MATGGIIDEKIFQRIVVDPFAVFWIFLYKVAYRFSRGSAMRGSSITRLVISISFAALQNSEIRTRKERKVPLSGNEPCGLSLPSQQTDHL